MRVRCRLSYNSTCIGILRDLSSEKSLWPAEQSRDATVGDGSRFWGGEMSLNEYDDNGRLKVEMDAGEKTTGLGGEQSGDKN